MKEIDFNFEDFNLSDHELLSSNMNYVARIKGIGVIKITPPGGALARFPNIKLFEDRILRDLIFNNYCKICPEVLNFDLSKRYFLMEDLGSNDLRTLLRSADADTATKLIDKLSLLFQKLDTFYDQQKDLPEIFQDENPLVKDHYAHIFVYPLFNHELVTKIWSDINLPQYQIAVLTSDYKEIKSLNIEKMDLSLLNSNTLIHGDLHTGSVIHHKSKFYLIDGEFAHLANRDFDLGMFFANLLIDLTLSDNDLTLLNGIKLRLSKTALFVALFELVRQMIGVSFSINPESRKSRKELILQIENIKASLSES